MRNLIIPFAVALIALSTDALSVSSEAMQRRGGGKGRPGGKGRGSCEDRVERLAEKFCDEGDTACADEAANLCLIEDRC